MSQTQTTVDIIIPVYRGLSETLSCLTSVLTSQTDNQTALNIIVIYDAGPEPELLTALQQKQNEHGFSLLINEENLGFVATVNRGMQQTDNDVILLNSDTEVANDWVDRLYFHGSQSDIASVTPFSNNATICSYPDFPLENDLPEGESVASLDKLFAKINAQQSVEIPTAIGFCMYIPRSAINQVGLFDVEAFGKGYGEENDFCLRGKALGLNNLQALDVFVWHKGSVSFSDSAVALRENALKVLTARYPDYEAVIQAHIKADPANVYRGVIDLQRFSRENESYLYVGNSEKSTLLQHHLPVHQPTTVFVNTDDATVNVNYLHQGRLKRISAATDFNALTEALSAFQFSNQFIASDASSNIVANTHGNKRGVLHITSFFGGGSLRNIEDLSSCLDSKTRQFILFASDDSQVLFDVLNGHYLALDLQQNGHWQLDVLLHYLGEQVDELVIHLHALFSASIDIAAELSTTVPTIATLHDHYFLTNQSFEDNRIREDQAWIEVIKEKTQHFKHFITPSEYLFKRAQPYFGERVSLINHGVDKPDSELDNFTIDLCESLMQAANWDKNKKTIAVIGAIGEHKGLSALYKIRRKMKDCQFLLIGYTSQSLTPGTGKRFIQHGLYHHKTIPLLLKKYAADVVLFLPGIAETYCYALSDVYGSLPVLAPDRGALGQRVQSEQLGEIYPTNINVKQLKAILLKLLADNRKITATFKTVTQMNKETEQFYLDFYDKDWKNIPVSDATLQDFMRESLSEENFKMAMVHLSRENYFLKRDMANLQAMKRVTIIDVAKRKIGKAIWLVRHNISVVRRHGLKQSFKKLINRFRSKL